MQVRGHDIGVCSWSLGAADIDHLIARVRELELSHVQLALGPLLAKDDAARRDDLARLHDSGIVLTAGMIAFPGEDYSTIAVIRSTGGFAPDEDWPARKALSLQAGELASQMGLPMLSTHVGFVPASSEKNYELMLQRVGDLAQALGKLGVALLMETGQEGASELLQFLNDLATPNVQVNFDPANMILYGAGDPIEAIAILGRHIRHVHVKDASLSSQPRLKWGNEVPFGTGEIRPREFLNALEKTGYRGALVIEREAGEERMRDVKHALDVLRSLG